MANSEHHHQDARAHETFDLTVLHFMLILFPIISHCNKFMVKRIDSDSFFFLFIFGSYWFTFFVFKMAKKGLNIWISKLYFFRCYQNIHKLNSSSGHLMSHCCDVSHACFLVHKRIDTSLCWYLMARGQVLAESCVQKRSLCLQK